MRSKSRDVLTATLGVGLAFSLSSCKKPEAPIGADSSENQREAMKLGHEVLNALQNGNVRRETSILLVPANRGERDFRPHEPVIFADDSDTQTEIFLQREKPNPAVPGSMSWWTVKLMIDDTPAHVNADPSGVPDSKIDSIMLESHECKTIEECNTGSLTSGQAAVSYSVNTLGLWQKQHINGIEDYPDEERLMQNILVPQDS